jgi:hypothetical protein
MTFQETLQRVQIMARAAGWSKNDEDMLVLTSNTVAEAEAIIAAAKPVPEHVRRIVLRDPRHSSHAARLAAMRDAAEAIAVLEIRCKAPYLSKLRAIAGYVYRDEAGRERLMSLPELREKLCNDLAEMDQHVDTTRPADHDALDAAAVYERRKAQPQSGSASSGGAR